MYGARAQVTKLTLLVTGAEPPYAWRVSDEVHIVAIFYPAAAPPPPQQGGPLPHGDGAGARLLEAHPVLQRWRTAHQPCRSGT